MIVRWINLQMGHELADSGREKRNLHFRASSVAFLHLKVTNHLHLFFTWNSRTYLIPCISRLWCGFLFWLLFDLCRCFFWLYFLFLRIHWCFCFFLSRHIFSRNEVFIVLYFEAWHNTLSLRLPIHL